jgi:hypothetical protein
MFNRETFLSYFYCVDGGMIALKGTCDEEQDCDQLNPNTRERGGVILWLAPLVRPERS